MGLLSWILWRFLFILMILFTIFHSCVLYLGLSAYLNMSTGILFVVYVWFCDCKCKELI